MEFKTANSTANPTATTSATVNSHSSSSSYSYPSPSLSQISHQSPILSNTSLSLPQLPQLPQLITKFTPNSPPMAPSRYILVHHPHENLMHLLNVPFCDIAFIKNFTIDDSLVVFFNFSDAKSFYDQNTPSNNTCIKTSYSDPHFVHAIVKDDPPINALIILNQGWIKITGIHSWPLQKVMQLMSSFGAIKSIHLESTIWFIEFYDLRDASFALKKLKESFNDPNVQVDYHCPIVFQESDDFITTKDLLDAFYDTNSPTVECSPGSFLFGNVNSSRPVVSQSLLHTDAFLESSSLNTQTKNNPNDTFNVLNNPWGLCEPNAVTKNWDLEIPVTPGNSPSLSKSVWGKDSILSRTSSPAWGNDYKKSPASSTPNSSSKHSSGSSNDYFSLPVIQKPWVTSPLRSVSCNFKNPVETKKSLKNTVLLSDIGLSGNEINSEAIANGLEKRTTFMIRNIPNKYSQQMLIDFLNQEQKGEYDFLYLRMDFKNKCNVGYAFINFKTSKSILKLSDRILGKKWPNFNSDKVATICFANIQGRGQLIEKFRNSSVMMELSHFRPKLFYTTGALIGEEEPFPIPSSRVKSKTDVLFSRIG